MTTATCDAAADHLGDLAGDQCDDVGVETHFAAAEHLAAELEQHAGVGGPVSVTASLHRWDWWIPPSDSFAVLACDCRPGRAADGSPNPASSRPRRTTSGCGWALSRGAPTAARRAPTCGPWPRRGRRSPAKPSKCSRKFSGTLAWMRAGRISSITQYLDTTSRSSSSVTALTGTVGGHGGSVEDQHEVRRARCGRPHDRLLVALPQFDRHRVEERRVDDRAEPAVVAGERADVGDLERGVGQAAPGRLRCARVRWPSATDPTRRW